MIKIEICCQFSKAVKITTFAFASFTIHSRNICNFSILHQNHLKIADFKHLASIFISNEN
jgi:hypothetical protein